LNEITRYRAALEIIYRRKWREYIKAGKARWQLQQALHHLKCRPLTKPFYKYRKEQFSVEGEGIEVVEAVGEDALWNLDLAGDDQHQLPAGEDDS
jgi:hypothetical protein